MQIGEIIRKYRKEKCLTQEQMADKLGLTAPAVNKWEKGISYPDITMLGPIARLLGIHTDILLSFTEDLSMKEINEIAEHVVELVMKEGLDSAFSYAMDQVYQYPNCDQLLLTMARVLQGYIAMSQCDKDKAEEYKRQVEQIYVQLTRSTDANIVASANGSLATYCSLRKDYEKAQEYLDKIPESGYDKRLMQAGLFRDQGKKEEAYARYEKYIYAEYMNVSMALSLLMSMYLDDQRYEEAETIASMCSGLAEALDMGDYQRLNPQFLIAVKRKDKDRIKKSAEQLIDSIDSIADVRESILCTHWKTKEPKQQKVGSFLQYFKGMIKEAMDQDSDLAELKDDPEFQRIISKLDISGKN